MALNWGPFCSSKAFENYWKCFFIHDSPSLSLSPALSLSHTHTHTHTTPYMYTILLLFHFYLCKSQNSVMLIVFLSAYLNLDFTSNFKVPGFGDSFPFFHPSLPLRIQMLVIENGVCVCFS